MAGQPPTGSFPAWDPDLGVGAPLPDSWQHWDILSETLTGTAGDDRSMVQYSQQHVTDVTANVILIKP